MFFMWWDLSTYTVYLLQPRSVKGFKKRWISSVVDGTDDDILRNGSEEDGNVKSQCGED